MKHIKIFKDKTTTTCTNGVWCCSTIWAKVEAEEFINCEDIKVLDIKYSNGYDGDSILIVYEEIR